MADYEHKETISLLRKSIKDAVLTPENVSLTNCDKQCQCSPVCCGFDKNGDFLLLLDQDHHSMLDRICDVVCLTVQVQIKPLDQSVSSQVAFYGYLNLIDLEDPSAESISCLYAHLLGRQRWLYRLNITSITCKKDLLCQSVAPDAFRCQQLFSRQQIQQTCQYMTFHQQEALRYYCQITGINDGKQFVELCYFDCEGFWIKVVNDLNYIPFSSTVSNVAMFKAVLIALAKQYGVIQLTQDQFEGL